MESAADRRHFWRAAFHAQATLSNASAEFEVEVLDLSLKGALVELPEHFAAALAQEFDLFLGLSDDDSIVMHVEIAYRADRRAGLRCTRIDLDSITHLRRLVELNSGDPGALERELAELLH